MERQLPGRRKIQRLFQRIEESTTSLISASSPLAKLCELCQRIEIQPMREGAFHSHGKPEEIRISARSGCPFCSLIVDNFDLGPPNVPLRLFGIRKKLSPQEKASLVEEGNIEALGVYNGYDRDLNPFAHKLALFAKHDDIISPFIKRRPPIGDFEAESTYRTIKSWLDTCILHHPGCSNSPVISKLPTRVLDVGLPGTNPDPSLFTPPLGYKDSYIALSYCWGNSDSKFVLSKQKADLPRPRFPFRSLPKTLQDAVTITRKLGFRFLWIDALCIIQEGDNGADFLRESVTMSQVYGNAALTIAAAGASDVHEGIFRKFTTKPVPEVQIQYDLPGGSTGAAFVTFEPVEQGDSRINEPLNTRGWTFQERILSHRVILFYKDQLGWDCTSTLINSNGPLNPLIQYNQDSPGRYSDYIVSRILTDTSPELRHREHLNYWRSLIEFYSRRKLTDTRDRLKAIAGLAQLIKSKTNDSYVAGLWLSDLPSQLFWHTKDPSEKRQDKYRAPTWSWASVDGQIRFWSPGSNKLLLRGNHSEPKVMMDFEPETDEFGIILRGRLTIKGHLFRPSAIKNSKLLAKSGREPTDYGLFFDTLNDQYEFFSKDNNNVEYFFFRLGKSQNFVPEDFKGQGVIAIMLRKTDAATYRRVGIFNKTIPLKFPGWDEWISEWGNVGKSTIIIE